MNTQSNAQVAKAKKNVGFVIEFVDFKSKKKEKGTIKSVIRSHDWFFYRIEKKDGIVAHKKIDSADIKIK